MDTYNIDGHKLNMHPERVAAWLRGEVTAPIYVEISSSGACNHRCVFCSMDYMGYRKKFLEPEITCARLGEMGAAGVKSVMFAGEGEPLLHPQIGGLAQAAKTAGIDISFTTNGVLLNEKLSEQLLPLTSWIKVSCNAGCAKDYSKIHRTAASDFAKVFANLEKAANIRAANGYACTLGIQCILLPQYSASIPDMAAKARDAGLDYLVVKPYTHNPASLNNAFDSVIYGQSAELRSRLQEEERDNFRIIFRNEAMSRWNSKKADFDHCMAWPFWAYIDAGGNVCGCGRHLQNEDFIYGNIYERPFMEIWRGEDRLRKVARCESCLDISECHVTCRMEPINNYLWRLRHPLPHDNFI